MTAPDLLRVEPATLWDRHDVLALDERPSTDSNRESELSTAIRAGELWVARRDGIVVGRAVWNREFFGNPFIWHLFVQPSSRRRGVATALIDHITRLCEGEKVFTSTNESNEPMHHLLPRLGFVRCGLVDLLDPGDPEVFYAKLPAMDAELEGASRADNGDR